MSQLQERKASLVICFLEKIMNEKTKDGLVLMVIFLVFILGLAGCIEKKETEQTKIKTQQKKDKWEELKTQKKEKREETKKVKIGETITVGYTKISPLEVKKGRIKTVKLINDTEALSELLLILVCRVENISQKQIFSPVTYYTFNESVLSDKHGNNIPTFKPGIEFNVVGQETKNYLPGVSREVLIAGKLPVISSSEFYWEIPICIDNTFTEVNICVVFSTEEIQE